MTTLFISHSSKDKAWAERMHQVLSDSDYQCLFLDSHPDDGIHAGAEWERTLWQELRQSRGIVVLCTANWLASPWCVAEAMIARERGKPLFMVLSANVGDDQIPAFLKDRDPIRLAKMTEADAQQRLWRGLAEEGLKDDFPAERPYPGLTAFQERDAGVFFGRDDEIKKVIDELRRCRRNNAEGFIVVLGASGCGKSSLVRAGVLPRLQSASRDDGSTAAWVIPPPFMAGQGLDGLAVSLEKAFKDAGQSPDLADIRKGRATASDLRTLGSKLRLAHDATEGSVLIVLDQLEEVFGTPEGSEARAALRLLLDASADASGSVVVLATMRSDFLNAFQLFEGAAKRYEEVTLDPMLRSHFSEVIEGPADRFGLDLDAGLSERMVEETAYNDALPLLAFTLEKLHTECGGAHCRLLELKKYEKLFPEVQVREENGSTTAYRGVSAAIKHAADAILFENGYAGLLENDPRMRDLRRAFYSLLARVGEEGQFTRRTARWSQMPPSCEHLLNRFVNQRLLVSGADNGERTLSVAHEALFRVWDTLRVWLRQDRKALALCGEIEEAAAEWDAENRAESRAWSEERIVNAVRGIEKSGVSLALVNDPNTVQAFLGPTDPDELATLPALGAAQDQVAGSGRYGDAWRLPLGHEARASVGKRLALLGDTRSGVGLRPDGLPDIKWCQINGGEVTLLIRSDRNDPTSKVDKKRTRPVNVKPFWMARYPVTIAQFQAFLKECYLGKGRWRLPPGAVEPSYTPPKHQARLGTHPADSLNWWDAAAYCHWLSARLHFEVRLPTEYEWQLAATGGNLERIYPWGAEWDPQAKPWLANTVESGLRGPTAVGMYPAGATAADVQDMAGTIWEWCRNAFDNPDNTRNPTSSQDYRVLRGGSWLSYSDIVRSDRRFWLEPDVRNYDIGCRVVCSSLSSDSDP